MTETQQAQNLGSVLALATERIVAPVEGMHHAIAGRWFRPTDTISEPVRLAHDVIANVAYGSIRLGAKAAGVGLNRGVAIESSKADSVQAFVNGLWGDALDTRGDSMEIPMAIRDRWGESVSVGPELAAAFPDATGRLVILVHGLVETEQCWRGTEDERGLAEVLEIDTALTPVPLRYNTGLWISDNGSRLASLLEGVSAEWPVPVQSIALVGHSMGGLVVRSACEAARVSGHRWIDDVESVVTVAAPHRGAPLEKVANAVAWGLRIAPETQPLADFINGRSVGIKDLRFGAIVENDWRGADPNALLHDTVGDHPLPPGIDHHFVAGVVTSDPSHPVGAAVGDLVVRAASGTGGRHLEPKNVVVVGGKNHFDLLRDPVVIGSMLSWLAPKPVVSPTVRG